MSKLVQQQNQNDFFSSFFIKMVSDNIHLQTIEHWRILLWLQRDKYHGTGSSCKVLLGSACLTALIQTEHLTRSSWSGSQSQPECSMHTNSHFLQVSQGCSRHSRQMVVVGMVDWSRRGGAIQVESREPQHVRPPHWHHLAPPRSRWRRGTFGEIAPWWRNGEGWSWIGRGTPVPQPGWPARQPSQSFLSTFFWVR